MSTKGDHWFFRQLEADVALESVSSAFQCFSGWPTRDITRMPFNPRLFDRHGLFGGPAQAPVDVAVIVTGQSCEVTAKSNRIAKQLTLVSCGR